MPDKRCHLLLVVSLALSVLPGCGVPKASLMVTPVIYHDDGIDPLAHLDEAHRSIAQTVFYATNRQRKSIRFDDPRTYNNTPTASLQVGKARVRYGDDIDWDQLHLATRALERDPKIPITLTDVWQHGSLDIEGLGYNPVPTDGADLFFGALNDQLAIAKDPEIVIYVHGAKVNFYDACINAAELNHFAGRDLVPIAFSWPTHQDIFRYLLGEDVARGRASAQQFEAFLRLLAQRTDARRINIICWSAGGRVVSRALEDLSYWEENHHRDSGEVRLGTVLFAAPDVPAHEFLERLPRLESIAERIVVTASDGDSALQKAAQFMGGGRRIGTMSADDAAAMPEDERAAIEGATRTELVNVSRGRAARGFDVTGHRYWFRHAWVASDVVLALRTRLPAHKRGLEPGVIRNVWYFPADYPDRVRKAAREALDGTW